MFRHDDVADQNSVWVPSCTLVEVGEIETEAILPVLVLLLQADNANIVTITARKKMTEAVVRIKGLRLNASNCFLCEGLFWFIVFDHLHDRWEFCNFPRERKKFRFLAVLFL